MKLSKKLTLSFIFSILISIVIISFISNYMINIRFENYLESEQAEKFKKIHEEVNNLLIENYSEINLMNLRQYALSQDLSLIIKDSDDNIIYNSNTSMGMGMNRHRMNMKHNIPEGNYVERTYPLTKGNTNLGSLVIGYIDNSYLTDSAIIFKDTLTKSFMLSGFITIFFGVLVSISLSKGLTSPLINITNTANKIRKGDLSAKSFINSTTTEIVELSESINYLGTTLSQQENIRKRYASDISHELRTPLTTLKTHLEAIIDGVWNPTNEHLDILMKEVTRLTNLVDDLKDSFIQEEYTMHINKTKFNISKVLEEIVTSFEPMYNHENYNLSTSIAMDIEAVVDKDKFKQVVNNILSNSLRYLNEGGNVVVELQQSQDSIILTVRDNGIGIKVEDMKHIFERFYRADTSRNKSTGGSGLGLSIVKSIVEAHNGTISFDSTFGIGTVVKVVLPKN